MAQEVIVFLIDDIDGTKAAETIRFSLDRNDYEIDLSETNAAGLRKALAEFIAHARKASGAARAVRVRERGNTEAIREWAARAGFDVKPRGRVPAPVTDAYRAAMRAGRVLNPEPRTEPAPDGSQEPADGPAESAAGNPAPAAQEPAPGSTEAIRAWAANTGREVKPRGRIPADVRAAYDLAQGGTR